MSTESTKKRFAISTNIEKWPIFGIFGPFWFLTKYPMSTDNNNGEYYLKASWQDCVASEERALRSPEP